MPGLRPLAVAALLPLTLAAAAAHATGGERWHIEAAADLDPMRASAVRELGDAIAARGGIIEASAGKAARVHRIVLAAGAPKLAADGYRITTLARRPFRRIACQGHDARGALYAAYDLAQRIRHGESLEDLEIEESPHCTVRQITAGVFCDYAHFARLLQAMPRWRMNSLLLYNTFPQPDAWNEGQGNFSGPVFDTYLALPITYRGHPEVRKMREASPLFRSTTTAFSALLPLAREQGVAVFLKFEFLHYVRIDAAGGHSEIQQRNMARDFPSLFVHGSPDWERQETYDFLAAALEELFDLYPGLAGIMATSDEMSLYNIGHKHSPGSPEQRAAWVQRAVDTIEGVCARRGKRCYWDLHGSGSVYQNALLAAARSRPGGLRLRAESTEGEQVFSDRFPSFPFSMVAQAGDGLCDHDISMEGLGDFPFFPNMVDRYVVRHVRAGLQAGLRGGGAMWYLYRNDHTPLDALCQINMEILSRLLWNPEESLDAVWSRWTVRRFGARAAPLAAHLLRDRTQEVINGLCYVNNLHMSLGFQYGFPDPSLGRLSFLLEYFQPEGTRLRRHFFNEILEERTVSMRQMRAEKQAAVRQAADLLREMEAGQAAFRPEDYRALLSRYAALWYLARSAEVLHEALYHFMNLHLKAYDPECRDPRPNLEKAIDALEGVRKDMANDPRLGWLEPDVRQRGLQWYFTRRLERMIPLLRSAHATLSLPAEARETLPDDQKAVWSWAQELRAALAAAP